MWRELTMPSATHARTVADRCRKATFEAPGSLVRGTVRNSTSKRALFWGRQRRRAFQVTMSWSKAMTSKWKYRISVRTVILNLSYFVFPFVKPERAPATPWPEFWRHGIGPVISTVGVTSWRGRGEAKNSSANQRRIAASEKAWNTFY